MFERARRAAKTRLHVSPKELRTLLVVFVLFMLGAMAFVWPNVKMVKIAYEYQTLTQEQRKLLRENNLLKVERESLKSLDRIQALARSRTELQPADDGEIVTVFLN